MRLPHKTGSTQLTNRSDFILSLARNSNKLEPVVKLTPITVTSAAAKWLQHMKISTTPRRIVEQQVTNSKWISSSACGSKAKIPSIKRRLFDSPVFKQPSNGNPPQTISDNQLDAQSTQASSNVTRLPRLVKQHRIAVSDVSDDDGSEYRPSENELSATDEEDEHPTQEINLEPGVSSLDVNTVSNSSRSSRTRSQLPAELKVYESMLPEWDMCVYEDEEQEIVKSATNGRKSRKSFCPYCKKNIVQLPRHVEALHKNEELVSKLTVLSKGDGERDRILRAIRLWGTYIYNNCRSYNRGILKVYQRPRQGVERDGADYVPCTNCGALIFKRRYGRHYSKCKNGFKLRYRSKENVVAGRTLNTCLHRNANVILRERIFPLLRVDDCTKAIRFDKAVIAYGNNIGLRYSMSSHHDKMIRANLRMLGRLLVISRRICPDVTDFASLLVPSKADVARDAINKVADLQETTGTYGHPASASQGAFAIKQLTLVWRTECIKMENYDSEKKVDRFLSILETQIIPMVDKLVTENRTRAQRKKKVVMPSMKDVETLNNFLVRGYTDCVNKLKSKFNYDTWKMLGSYGLVALLVYNKRRPGEMDRILLENFNALMQIDGNNELYSTLTEEEKKLANRNMLFVIRGKLNRTVSVFVSPSLKNSLDLFLSLREEAGVSSSNPYLFGLPGTNPKSHKYLESCSLLRLFSKQCNASNPITLRATVLRKSLATMAASLQLPEMVTKDLADHMGHDIGIHKNIYRQVTYQKSVLNVAGALEKAIGQYNVNADSDEMPLEASVMPAAESEVTMPTTSKIHHGKTQNRVLVPKRKRSLKMNSNKINGQVFTDGHISSLSEKEILIVKKTYLEKKKELNRSPLARDLEAMMKLPQMQNASLPNVMLYIDNMEGKPNTPRKRRYADSPHIVRSPKIRKRNSAQRTPWTEASLDALEQLFGNYLNGSSTKMPSKSDVELAINTHEVLRGRTVAVVKTCLHNMRNRRQF